MTNNLTVISKVFNGHFFDAEYHFERSAYYHRIVEASATDSSADQAALAQCRAHGRASIVAVIAGCESLCQCLVKQFAKRSIECLPVDWVPRKWRGRQFSNWSVATKLRFVPVLCGTELSSPSTFYKDSVEDLAQFDEIVKIRNSLIHGADVELLYTVEFRSGNCHIMRDDAESNFWPVTHISLDPRSIIFPEVERIYQLVMRVSAQAITYVGKLVDERWLRDDSAEFGNEKLTFRRGAVTDGPPPNWVKILLRS